MVDRGTAVSVLLTEFYNETISLTDSLINTLNKVLTETLTLSDGDAYSPSRTLSETLTLTDNYSRVWLATSTFSETLTLSEDFEGLITIEKELTETLTLTDNYSRVWLATPTLTETLTLSDVFSTAWTLSKEYTETLTLTDSFEGNVPSIFFVQYDDYFNNAAGTTIANDTALNTTTGNFLVAVINLYGSGDIVSSVADTAGNTYVKAIGVNRSGAGERSEIWYAKNITGNANNITTATFNQATSFRYISIAEYSGVDTSSPLDDTASYSNSSVTLHTSSNATASESNELIIGGYSGASSENITVGANFTTLSSDLTTVYNFAEYRILSSSGDYAATCITGTTNSTIMVAAIFKPGGESYPKTLTETLTLTDVDSYVWVLSREYTETLSLSDGDTYSPSRTLSETLTLTDVDTYSLSRTLSETLNLTDTDNYGISIILSDNLILSDSVNELTSDLISYYKLDESVGDVIDSHGSNDGTNNGATRGVTGKLNDAFSFDGNDYVDCGSDLSLQPTNEITISCWIKPTSAQEVCWVDPGPGNYGVIASVNDPISSSTWSWQLRYGAPTACRLGFQLHTSAGTAWVELNQNLTVGTWYHVVATFDGTYSKIYLNGILKDTHNFGATTIVTDPANKILIGDEGWANYFDGVVDEVGIWDKALDSTLISKLYNNGDGTTYPFGETKTLSETLTLSDTIKVFLGINLSETLTLTDDVDATKSGDWQKELTETLTLTDVDTRVWLATSTLSETLTISDGDTYSQSRTLSETLTLSDVDSRVWLSTQTLSETLILTDAFEGTTGIQLNLSETISLSDNYSRVWSATETYSETLTLTDNYSRVWFATPEFSETLTLSDGDTYSPSKVLSETLTLTDNYSRVWSATEEYTETLTLTDGDTYSLEIILTETLTLSDGDIYSPSRTLSETLILTDVNTYSPSRTLSETLTFSYSLDFSTNNVLSETITLTDAYSRVWLATPEFSETITLTEAFNKGLSKEYTEILSFADSLILAYAYSQILSETLTLSDGDIHSIQQVLTETINLNDIGIILIGQGELIISTSSIKPVLVSTESGDYEL